jgi:hypothetical protein
LVERPVSWAEAFTRAVDALRAVLEVLVVSAVLLFPYWKM